MAQWADFSGPPPDAAALKAAGFSGVICYIGLGSEGKQIHAAQYQDYVRNGLQVLLVAELGTGDAWSALDDYATGKARAQLALADARNEGIPDTVGIACAADAHASSAAQISDAVQYARGFAAVLGKQRTGFYGFVETSSAVHAADVVGWHWRCGSEPSTQDKQWVHFWQRNRSPQAVTVSGTVCDINDALAPLHIGTTNPEETDMPLTGNDGNVLWAAIDPDTGEKETHELAHWIGIPAYRTGRIQADVQALAVVQAETLAAVTGGNIDPKALLDRIDTGVREATEKTVTSVLLPAVQRIEAALAENDIDMAKAVVAEIGAQLRPAV